MNRVASALVVAAVLWGCADDARPCGEGTGDAACGGGGAGGIDPGGGGEGGCASSGCNVCQNASLLSSEGPAWTAPGLDYVESFAIADLDGDGYDDVLAARSKAVEVFGNLGNHRFEEHKVATTSRAESVAVVDFDQDGDGDLVFCDEEVGISVLVNRGEFDFQLIQTIDLLDCEQLVAADIDGDGLTDLAVATYFSVFAYPDAGPAVLWGMGNMGIDPQPFDTAIRHVVTGGDPESVAVADFDGDGDLDLAVADEYSWELTVVKNQGGREFVADPGTALNDTVQALAAGDLDGDGDADLVAAGESGLVEVFANTDGTLLPSVQLEAGNRTWGVIVADLDQDGALDLAAASRDTHAVSMWRNLGDLTFASPILLDALGEPVALAAGFFDGDCQPDLLVGAKLDLGGVFFTEQLCGNASVDRGETCDDGNLVDGDGCDSNCTSTGCGNGILTAGEVCDDGNLTSGDGCAGDCLSTN
ncbi:MAG: FG-GAP-like repeat-containing protein [Polyangiaceae bacterium]